MLGLLLMTILGGSFPQIYALASFIPIFAYGHVVLLRVLERLS
jgi:hypothetical protein